MARRAETREVDGAFGRKRLHAARAYLKQAKRSRDEAGDEYDRATAMSSAILAAIAAADALCALRLRQTWQGEHAQAHSLLRQVRGADEAANALRRVVSNKAAVQYMAGSTTAHKLEVAIRQAEAVVDLAEGLYSEG